MITGWLKEGAEAYHADPFKAPSLSSSIAKTLIAKSPRHAWADHPKLGGGSGKKPTKEMDQGTLIHSLVLGVGAEIVRVEADNWKTKAAQVAREEARKEGKVAVLEREYVAASGAAVSIIEQMRGHGIELTGRSEAALAWVEESYDGEPVQCRGMLDHVDVGAGAVLDLKVVVSAEPRFLERHVINMGNHIQAEAYRRALAAVEPTLQGRVDFKWVFVEMVEPTPVVVVGRPSGTMRELGDRQWRRAVDTWARCLAAKSWPAYADSGVVELEAPAWALAADYEACGGEDMA